jgi:glucan phosphoethanolaminetransferase (alkaline phosphatase superfamily)
VLGFDHHCFWIGNCVGSRNYASFFGFLITLFTILGLSVLCIIHQFTVDDPLKPQLIILGLVILTIFVLISVLLGYHLKLMALNLTTNEHLKKTLSPYKTNPFNKYSYACLSSCLSKHLYGQTPISLRLLRSKIAVMPTAENSLH